MTRAESMTDEHGYQAPPLRDLYFELGRALSAHRRGSEAEQAFQQALREEGRIADFEVYRALSAECDRLDERERALRYCLEGMLAAPDRVAEMMPRAHELLPRKMPPENIAWLHDTWAPAMEHALSNSPRLGDVLAFLGRVDLYAGDYPRALAFWQRAAALCPDDVHSVEGFGESLWRTGADLQQSEQLLRRAADLCRPLGNPPRLHAITTKLAAVLVAQNRYESALVEIARLDPDPWPYAYDVALLRGLSLLGLGKPADALAAAETACAWAREGLAQQTLRPRILAPESVEPQALRVRALIALHRYSEAIAGADAALQDDPTNAGLPLCKAQALIEGQVDVEQGLRLLRRRADRISETDVQSTVLGRTGDGNLHYFLAHLYRVLGRGDAEQEVTRALDLGLTNVPFGTARAHQLKGELLAERGKHDEAAEAFVTAGSQFVSGNDPASAVPVYRAAISARPTARAYWMLADALRLASTVPTPPYVDRQKIDEGIAAWKQGAAIEAPREDTSWAYLAWALLVEQLATVSGPSERAALWWEALAHGERALVWDRSQSSRWSFLARFYRDLDLEPIAIPASDEAIRLAPGDIQALDEQAAALANQGLLDRAEAAIRQRLSVQNAPWAHAVLAYVLLRRDRVDEALKEADAATAGEPDILWYRGLRAACLRRLERFDDERVENTYVWERYQPDLTSELSGFATAAMYLGHTAEALAILERCYEDTPQKSFLTHGDLAVGLLAHGDLARASEHLAAAIPLAANVRQLRDLRDDVRAAARIASANADPSEVARLVDRVLADVQRQIDQMPALRSPLQALQAIDTAAPGAGPWCDTAVRAGIARLLVEADKWDEAAHEYMVLRERPEQFPEARVALERLVRKCADCAEEQLRAGNADAGIAQLTFARGLAAQVAPDTANGIHLRLASDLLRMRRLDDARSEFEGLLASDDRAIDRSYVHAALALVHLLAGDTASSHQHLDRALTVSEGAPPEAAQLAASTIRTFIAGPDDYLAIDADWEAFAEALPAGDPRRNRLADARASLAAYLDGLYRLEEPGSDLFPVLTPLSLELGMALIPDNTDARAWPLLGEHLPRMRAAIKADTGIAIPGVRVFANTSVPPDGYRVLLQEMLVEQGSVQMLAEAKRRKDGDDAPVDGTRSVVDRLESLIRANLATLVGIQEAMNLVTEWKETLPSAAVLTHRLSSRPEARVRMARVLAALAADGVPLAARADLVEALLPVLEGASPIADAASRVRAVISGTGGDRPQPITREGATS